MDDAATIRHGGATSPVLLAAWDRYRATLEELRVAIEKSRQYAEAPAQRGVGFRHLMEVQAMAYNFVIAPRTEHPRMIRNTCWQTDYYCIGGNGPDFDYRTSFLDGRHTYRLTGKFNDSRMIVAQMNSATPGIDNSRCMANYDFTQFELGKDKSFEVIISAKKHDGNWIEMLPGGDYQWLFIRPTAETWDERPAEFVIERISDLPPVDLADEYSEEAVARRIDFATSFAHYVITEWAIGYVPFIEGKAGGKNLFMTLGLIGGGELGNPAAHYQHCVFQVEHDEALILHFEHEPQGAYWSLQLYDIWHRTIPFRTRQATLSGRQIVKNPDGSVDVVVSRLDPGLANWLDNAGVTIGEVAWRTYQVTKDPRCDIRRVKFEDVHRSLPADMKRVSAEERARELKLREAAYRSRHGE